MAVAMGIGRFVYTLILPGMMEELGLRLDAGLIASANYLGYLVGALAAAGGWASGRERMVMLGGLAGSALLAAAMGLTESFAAFLVIRFLAGLRQRLRHGVPGEHRLQPSRRGRPQRSAGRYFGGVGLGIAASSALMAVSSPTMPAGRRAGCGRRRFRLAVVVVAWLVGSGSTANGVAGREPALPKDDRPLLKMIVAYGLFGFGYMVTATFLVAIVRQGDGGRVFEAAVWMVTGLAGLPSVWLWQKVARRVAFTRPTPSAASSRWSASPPASPSAAMPGRCWPAFCSAAPSSLSPRSACNGRTLVPLAPRRILAMMTAAFGIGQIVGPIAAGLLAQASGNYVLASVMAAVILLASGSIAWSAAPKSP